MDKAAETVPVVKVATFLHLSDIHFNRHSGTAHDLDADVRNELVRDAVSLLSSLGVPCGILVTGDIAFSGARAEYELAAKWLEELCRGVGCPEESVFVVPGNHDIDRHQAATKLTRMLHEGIRARSEKELDDELRVNLTDASTADILFAPIANYNSFAARYKCSISPANLFRERDIRLECGTTLRLRGLNSVLVSNASDARGNLVLGGAQVAIQRQAGIEYITLCHHPADWLLDQDAVTNQLEARVRIQLFGHKHMQRLRKVNETLHLVAGAAHPERKEGDWEPTFNVVQVSRHDEHSLLVKVFQRRWNKNACQFTAEVSPSTGEIHQSFKLANSPSPPRNSMPVVEPPSGSGSPPLPLEVSSVQDEKTATSQSTTGTSSPERRMTYRFLTLPFRHQMAIAQALDLLTDEDQALAEELLFRVLFERAAKSGKLAQLWDETERRHDGTPGENPFSGR